MYIIIFFAVFCNLNFGFSFAVICRYFFLLFIRFLLRNQKIVTFYTTSNIKGTTHESMKNRHNYHISPTFIHHQVPRVDNLQQINSILLSRVGWITLFFLGGSSNKQEQ